MNLVGLVLFWCIMPCFILSWLIYFWAKLLSWANAITFQFYSCQSHNFRSGWQCCWSCEFVNFVNMLTIFDQSVNYTACCQLKCTVFCELSCWLSNSVNSAVYPAPINCQILTKLNCQTSCQLSVHECYICMFKIYQVSCQLKVSTVIFHWTQLSTEMLIINPYWIGNWTSYC